MNSERVLWSDLLMACFRYLAPCYMGLLPYINGQISTWKKLLKINCNCIEDFYVIFGKQCLLNKVILSRWPGSFLKWMKGVSHYLENQQLKTQVFQIIDMNLDIYPIWMGFPDSSVGKESARNAGDPGLIAGSGRSPGEGIGYPLQYYWASLVVQLVKNLPAMWETRVQSLGWEDPLEKGKATHSSILAWKIPWDHKESDMTE